MKNFNKTNMTTTRSSIPSTTEPGKMKAGLGSVKNHFADGGIVKPPEEKPVVSGRFSDVELESLRNIGAWMDNIIDSDSELAEKTLHGDAAVKEIEKLEGELTPHQKRVAKLEGFVPQPYLDSKGVLTYGVGQTGEFIDKPFKEVFEDHKNRVRNKVNNFDKLPSRVQRELIQADFRGDVAPDHNWLSELNKGNYKKAGEKFLNHKEYKKYKRKRAAGDKNAGGNIPERMDAVANALKSMAKK